MKKQLMILALVFVGCNHSDEPSGPHMSNEWQIWAYSSAAPSYIAENATILDPTMAVLLSLIHI